MLGKVTIHFEIQEMNYINFFIQRVRISTILLYFSFFCRYRSLPLMCIAPLGKDALECLRYTDNVEKSIRNVISTSWPPGKT